jgi:hypothetical protein
MAPPKTGQIEIVGLEDVTSKLTILATTVKGFSRTVEVGSALPYAYGQETGIHRVSGRRARSGPTYFLTFSAQEVLDTVDDDLIKGLEMSASGRKLTGLGQVVRVGRWIARIARKHAPRQTGRLAKSIRVKVSKSGRIR